ncbi:GDSL-type esterase/lipase family protein [Kribbella sp. C-35]|uniref:GDSL-type esterase/lipase family protein n=1 Tax=Kribbella sp. C-35 TaxID=2789276 RepID=UPI00397B498D
MDGERVALIVSRLSLFVATAVLLVVVCRQGATLFHVVLVFTLYVAVAAVWVSGQHQASVKAARSKNADERPWTFPYWISLPAVGVGAVLFGVGLGKHVGSLLIAGVLLFYLGAGYVLMRFRQWGFNGGKKERVGAERWHGAGRLPIGGVLLVLGLILVLVGSFLIRIDSTNVGVVLSAVGALVMPGGLTVLTEPTVTCLEGKATRLVVFAIGGAVLFGGSFAIVVVRRQGATPTMWIVTAFVAVALLVFAIVSSTQADIAAVIAAVALMGVTPAAAAPAREFPATNGPRALVALGDSYMSGEGAQVYYEKTDESRGKDRNLCHRAPTAWAAIAGRNDFNTTKSVACQGASTRNVRLTGQSQFSEPGTQLQQLQQLMQDGLKPSLVVISLGGNDAGFSTIGAMCIAPGNCNEQAHLWTESLGQVRKNLAETYKQVREVSKTAPVLVIPYAAPVYVDTAGKPRKCAQAALSQGDLEFINNFVQALNLTIQAAALNEKFYFLDGMQNALADAHLQLCDPDNGNRPGINFIGLRSVAGIAEQRFNPENWYHNSLHPNASGHLAMLQVFEHWRADHPDPEQNNPEAADDLAKLPAITEILTKANKSDKAAGKAGKDLRPQCQLYKDSELATELDDINTCRENGANWAKDQLSKSLLEDGGWVFYILAAAAGAWLLAVWFYGWRRPWWQEAEDSPASGSPLTHQAERGDGSARSP